MKQLGGHGPGPSPYWNESQPRSGLVHGFFHNLCHAICSCCYVFSCCWLIEDCFTGQRSFPAPSYGPLEPPPPPPPAAVFGHQHHGLLGSVIGGPPGPSSRPGPFGYSDEPPPPPYR
ncbi:hypothetical protein C2S51_021388 [Perilla frutescens var. frutescens]|nr:hypothetical protein C2S51_021388 [Perilla frutescens var. frutescens]